MWWHGRFGSRGFGMGFPAFDFGFHGIKAKLLGHRICGTAIIARDHNETYAERMQIGRDQAPGQSGGGDTGGGNTVIKLAIAGAGRIDRPMRRPQPLHPAARDAEAEPVRQPLEHLLRRAGRTNRAKRPCGGRRAS